MIMDVQALIEPLPIPLNREVTEKVKQCIVINTKGRWDPTSTTSKTYNIELATFKNGKPEELIQTTKDFKTKIYGIGTTSDTRKPHYLRAILRGEDLRELYDLASHVVGMKKSHLNFIKEELLN